MDSDDKKDEEKAEEDGEDDDDEEAFHKWSFRIFCKYFPKKLVSDGGICSWKKKIYLNLETPSCKSHSQLGSM